MSLTPAQLARSFDSRYRFLGKEGKVVSFSLIRVAPERLRQLVPYVVAIVDFGSAQATLSLADVRDDEVFVGMKVVGVLRRLYEPSKEGVIPYGVKGATLEGVRSMEKIVVVNRSDRIRGTKEKLACHRRRATVHRGFAAIIMDETSRILLSKRSRKKPLWPLFWDNSCSSHPRLGETYSGAGERRLSFELGFTTSLKYLFKFRYQADYDERLAEQEICGVLVGRYSGDVRPNPHEVAETRWVSFSDLGREIDENGGRFTPWLKKALERIQRKDSFRKYFIYPSSSRMRT